MLFIADHLNCVTVLFRVCHVYMLVEVTFLRNLLSDTVDIFKGIVLYAFSKE